MQRTFLVCLLTLSAASAALYWTLPEQRAGRPLLYWVTQDDPVKRETIELFYQWRAQRGLPPVEVRIDSANVDPTKKLVQGVSGVGGDLIDVYELQLEMLQATGMLADLTDVAQRMGFGPDRTYAMARDDVMVQGRQYGFPRNVEVTLCWINRDTFARYGVPEPPTRWTWDEFEALGKRFVAAANPPGTKHRVFFLSRIWRDTLRRSCGAATFNETQTRCVLDTPASIEMLRRLYRWTIEERLMPTQEEDRAFAADASGWDAAFALFAAGRYAMLYEGRWALIRLRPRGDLNLRVVEPFNNGFPVTQGGAGLVSIFAGTKHPQEAAEFLQFLTSKDFNLLVARSGDSLPPVPAYAQTEAFLHPAGHPNEWGVHAEFAKAGHTIAITASKSPFVLPMMVDRIDTEVVDAMLAQRLSPEAAARELTDRLNGEMALNVKQDPALRKLYDERMALQHAIDGRRAAGQRVPAAWIADPYQRALYRAHGWLEEGAAK
ncbi:extracellular solute-binding protein [Horticoccus luteus]|uniref:Extracellular solute-binding protein n=1 Tax=Horticoccus luteus TaxID=2862869 RepID=A0A8F9XHJ6_9BACT|nr:extracellular solute-binding protein [Horticoccus luteus]QYM80317.1 extracellular solute-binding protein [Horticoccus luteus]